MMFGARRDDCVKKVYGNSSTFGFAPPPPPDAASLLPFRPFTFPSTVVSSTTTTVGIPDSSSRRDDCVKKVYTNSSTFAFFPPPPPDAASVFPFTLPSTVVSSTTTTVGIPDSRPRRDNCVKKVYGNSSTFATAAPPPPDAASVFSFTLPSSVVSSTTTVGMPESSSFGSPFAAKSTVHAPTAYPSSGSVTAPPWHFVAASSKVANANNYGRSLGSCASYVLNEAPTSIASAASDLLTSMLENAENVVNEGHFPRAEEHQMQKIVEEGERGTEPGPISSQTAIPSNDSAVLHFGTPDSVETFKKEVKEMQKSAAEDSSMSELSMDFNLLTNGSRILRGIPQSPHFCSMPDYPGRVRENLISGWDKTFEETYDQIQSLKATDFWNSKYELELTLNALESMGYNVSCMRKRFDELINLMEKRESKLFAIWSLRTKIENHNREKQKLEGKIYNLQIKAGKEQASINGLLDEVAKLEESLPVAESLFASLVASPL